MEFIPLERDSEKVKDKRKIATAKSSKKLKLDETNKESNFNKGKQKSKFRGLEKKNVKNKYKETLALKWKDKALKKKIQKVKKNEEEEEEEEEEVVSNHEEETEVKEEVNDEEEEVDDDDNDDEEEDEDEDEEEQEKNKEEEAFKRKCKEMDEKKKNRLFIKLKKKIINESMIKELHPNIRGVIFPRKKKSRWCWAVFASEAKANEALKQLRKNKEILASKPNPYERVDQKRKEKIKTVLRKKETKKKLQNIWM